MGTYLLSERGCCQELAGRLAGTRYVQVSKVGAHGIDLDCACALKAERGGAGKPTKMHYLRVIQSDWCICIPMQTA